MEDYPNAPQASTPSYPAGLEWPTQRLRWGSVLILFFLFEILIGQQLPIIIPYVSLLIGILTLLSAYRTVRTLKAEGEGDA